jgi:hypothetical protein
MWNALLTVAPGLRRAARSASLVKKPLDGCVTEDLCSGVYPEAGRLSVIRFI